MSTELWKCKSSQVHQYVLCDVMEFLMHQIECEPRIATFESSIRESSSTFHQVAFLTNLQHISLPPPPFLLHLAFLSLHCRSTRMESCLFGNPSILHSPRHSLAPPPPSPMHTSLPHFGKMLTFAMQVTFTMRHTMQTTLAPVSY